MCFFFFQAEDGIRDYKVTGVQTCALPISMTAAQGMMGKSTKKFVCGTTPVRWSSDQAGANEPKAGSLTVSVKSWVAMTNSPRVSITDSGSHTSAASTIMAHPKDQITPPKCQG